MIKYYPAPDVEKLFMDVVSSLGFEHIDCSKIRFFRSRGSKSKRTIARIHGLPRIWQHGLGIKPHYLLEVVSERYDPLSEEEREKTLIHELLHIPKGFSGGFRPHKGYITRAFVEKLHKTLLKRRSHRKKRTSVTSG